MMTIRILKNTSSVPAPNINETQPKNPNALNWLPHYYRFLRGRSARYQSRKQLIQLDDHLLDDVGITRDQALQEIQKSYWK